jgi:hypothetical protein
VLQHVFNEAIDQIDLVLDEEKTQSVNMYRHDLTLSFFLAVEMENERLCRHIYNIDPWLRHLINIKIIEPHKNSDETKSVIQEVKPEYTKKQTKSVDENPRKPIISENSGSQDIRYEIDFLFSFEDSDFNIKTIMQCISSEHFFSNLITIALLAKEEIIASVIIVDYPCRVDESTVKLAINSEMFDFMKFMWRFQKNYYYIGQKKVTFTYKTFFDFIIKWNQNNFTTRIKEVADWKLQVEGENLLLALLQANMDQIACSNIQFYHFDVNLDLFYWALDNDNEVFLKYSMKEGVFSSFNIFEKQEVIDKLFGYIEKGVKIDL